jgi:hypothetical protein
MLQMNKKAWVVSADMGYGHQRAVHPLRDRAEEGIISVGKNDAASSLERRLWSQLLGVYEFFSRSRAIPVIGKPLFNILDRFLRIPSFYPMRNLSSSTFQVNLLSSFVRRGLCSGMLARIRTKHLPMVTSFFASAIAADMSGYDQIYCIICDADLNRVWVAKEPWESRITYFAPCGKAAQRLKAYGVPEERILLTGFPLPDELVGGKDLSILRHDLGQRLHYLDPNNRFWPLHGKNVRHFLGDGHCIFERERVLTISFVIGGAGAQKEIGGKIARSLKDRILAGTLKLNLIAGVKEPVRTYFERIKSEIAPHTDNLTVISARTLEENFEKFNTVLRETDILWTKPSELSFYCALGIPIITTPTIGSQEKFNRQWLLELQAGIRQENPEYADQWLFEWLSNGRFAEAAWSGFLKARKLGTHKILEVLDTGRITHDTSPLFR